MKNRYLLLAGLVFISEFIAYLGNWSLDHIFWSLVWTPGFSLAKASSLSFYFPAGHVAGCIVGAFPSDLVGRKPVLIGGLSALVVFFVGMSVGSLYWHYALCGVIGGLGTGLFFISSLPVLIESFPGRCGLVVVANSYLTAMGGRFWAMFVRQQDFVWLKSSGFLLLCGLLLLLVIAVIWRCEFPPLNRSPLGCDDKNKGLTVKSGLAILILLLALILGIQAHGLNTKFLLASILSNGDLNIFANISGSIDLAVTCGMAAAGPIAVLLLLKLKRVPYILFASYGLAAVILLTFYRIHNPAYIFVAGGLLVACFWLAVPLINTFIGETFYWVKARALVLVYALQTLVVALMVPVKQVFLKEMSSPVPAATFYLLIFVVCALLALLLAKQPTLSARRGNKTIADPSED